MITEKESSYSRQVDAVALYPGNCRDSEAKYMRTLVAEVEGLAQNIYIDVDENGKILMFEIMGASDVFSPEILRTLKQID